MAELSRAWDVRLSWWDDKAASQKPRKCDRIRRLGVEAASRSKQRCFGYFGLDLWWTDDPLRASTDDPADLQH